MSIPNPTNPGHLSEFEWDAALKRWLGDSCGDVMSAHMAAMADGRKVSVADMLSIYNDLYFRDIAHRPGKGGSTLSEQRMELEKRGYKTSLYMGYEDPFTPDWLGALRKYAGKQPIGLFLTNANELVDAQTGIGYSWRKPFVKTGPGLQGHFIAVVAQCPLGYICADGANPQVAKRYAIYRADTLQKAGVHGLLMIEMKNGVKSLYTSNPDGTLSYPNGNLLGGFSDFVIQNNVSADLDIPDTSFSPTESFCVFKDGRVLYWSQATGVLDMGMSGVIVKAMYDRPVGKVDLSGVKNALNNAITELEKVAA